MNTKWYGARIALLVLALAGLAIMSYLVSLHFAPDTAGSFCNLGEGLSCDIVNKSEYSTVLGIPLSVLGALYFLTISLITIFWYRKESVEAVSIVSILFLGPSLYLSGIEFFVIKNICIFCEISKVIMAALVGTSIVALRPARLSGSIIGATVLAALVLGFATFFIQGSSGPGGTYNEFAQCLTDKQFVVYGSKGCAYCARQRAMFGDAFERIKEIECDPRYPNPQTERCVAKGIEKTPTWIQEDASGKELQRMSPGLQSFEALSKASQCPLPVNN